MTSDLDERGPGPESDEDSAFYWEGLREHRLLLQQCLECRETRFPPMPGCPNCGSPRSKVVEASGAGTVYSWISVHRAMTDDPLLELPYDIVVIELAEGCRMVARYCSGQPRIGVPVAPSFHDHGEWTELVFGAMPQ